MEQSHVVRLIPCKDHLFGQRFGVSCNLLHGRGSTVRVEHGEAFCSGSRNTLRQSFAFFSERRRRSGKVPVLFQNRLIPMPKQTTTAVATLIGISASRRRVRRGERSVRALKFRWGTGGSDSVAAAAKMASSVAVSGRTRGLWSSAHFASESAWYSSVSASSRRCARVVTSAFASP